MDNFDTIKELIEIAEKKEITLAQVVIEREIEITELTEKEVRQKMKETLEVMRDSVEPALKQDIKSMSGLTGGDAKLVDQARKE
ncbi:MAG: L-serine ammonia-lyase, iron-sulfur-dependent, subunit alpha, partial [Halanaerobium sp.]